MIHEEKDLSPRARMLMEEEEIEDTVPPFKDSEVGKVKTKV